MPWRNRRLARVLPSPRPLVDLWIDLERPDGDEIDRLAEPLDLRPESVGALTDDHASATPTFSDFGDYLHVTVRAPTDDDELRRVDCLHFAVPSYGGMTKYPVGESTSRRGGTKMESSLYERLGGAFAIAAVVDHFSDAIVKNPIVGQQSENAQLREWHTNNLGRLPGLKFMRTLWVCTVAGGPQEYAARNRAILHSAWKWRIGN